MPKVVIDEDVFSAVMDLMIASGYSGTTTKQMAEAAGISEVSLFRKYGSKAQLVRMAVVSIAERFDFESACVYTGNIEDDLLRIVKLYQKLAAHHGQFMAMLIPELSRYPELRDALERPVKVIGQISALIKQYQDEGILKHENPLHTVSSLLGPLLYSSLLKGSLLDADLEPADLKKHVEDFLYGRRSSQGRS